jgi:suppressor for copper-sensitivity B
MLAGGALAAALAMLAARRRLPQRSRPAAAVAAVALALAAMAAPQGGAITDAAGEAGGAIRWVPFDQAVLAEAVASGRTVFVDVTADWCITCKVNKAAVVERGEVARRLGEGGVMAMKADWTRPDDGIARYLASFGRYGIPFNAVYGPGARDGIPLPELLTEAEVLAALDKAGR